eukprot:CAMPEP_0201690516 /NCGR_PEP_ID=MMETSP0578-20130828/3944_1 /ASSEMBLY_ACC=CAM_ASM_000663 /TAXON_ID=267565 /ORGANISM="Skeletonema grethea, Strain CCMP 1804" /LENGTH=665 /DNA_ID=CAMNT_0048175533 /DNA_START=212 /DNA_END=2209 /DNA_ORIENTATION=+
MRSSAPPHSPRRREGTAVGSRYIALPLVLCFMCFISFLTYHRILSPYAEVMSASIDQPLLSDDNDDLSNKPAVDDKQILFQPTAFHQHIQLRQSNYVHHNNLTHSSKSTFGRGKNSNIRISFQLHDPKVVPINNTLWELACPVGMNPIFYRRGRPPNRVRVDPEEVRSGILPPSLTRVTQRNDYPREGRVLDFTATISTDLKILHIGDSVGVQLAQGFDEMVGCRNDIVSGNGTGFCRPRISHSAPLAGIGHDSHSILSPTIGGGVSAMWRMTGLLSKINEGKKPANAGGGGWSMSEVINFLNYDLEMPEHSMSFTAQQGNGKEAKLSTSESGSGGIKATKSSCTFCEILNDPELVVAGTGGNTCRSIQLMAAGKVNGSDVCAIIQKEERVCCARRYLVPMNEGNRSDSEEAEGHVPNLVQKYNAVVFRVMHGWMKSKEISHRRLVEAVELSHELLGAESVVLMTVPFSNNVKTPEDFNEVNRINADIRDIAHGWHVQNSTGVKHVLVQEYGTYHNHIIWSNAKHIGYNVSAPLTMTHEMFDTEGPTFLNDRLKTGKTWDPSIAQVCSERDWSRTEMAKCKRSYLYKDGMHICPETLATRHGIAVACLLGCVYNRKSAIDSNQLQQDEINLRACERECNEQFMSVMPVDESWIDSNTELASFATA